MGTQPARRRSRPGQSSTKMKMVIKGALALALLASTAGAALAQDQAEDHDRWHNAGERPRPQQRQEAPRPEAPRAEAPRAQPQAQQVQVPQAQPRNVQGPGGWQRGPDGRNFRGAPDGQRGDGQQGGDRGGDRNWRQPAEPAVQPPAAVPQNRANDPRQGGDRRWDGDRNDGRRWDNDRNRNDGRGWDGRGWDGRSWNDNRDHQWRGGDHRQDRPHYDPRNYPRQWRSPQRYRGYNYRPPPGFYSRSWVFGDILPRTWWTPDYRLNNWWDYGLPIPPIGYEWVRVGDDALLVDIYSGRVVQVAYDIFW